MYTRDIDMTTRQIRLATRADLEVVTNLVVEFLQTTTYKEHIQELDIKHITKLAYAVIQVGRVWLYEVDKVAVGLLMAVMEQNVWIQSKQSLRELVWYVREEFRGSPTAAKLFIEFCREGEKLLNNGQIDGYFTTRMSSTTNYDLSKRGFREVERLFLKD